VLFRSALRENGARSVSLEDARTIANRSLKTLEAAYRTDQPEIATAYTVLGEILLALNLHGESADALNHSLVMRESVLPPGSWQIGESLYLLGRSALATGDIEIAHARLTRAASIFERTRRKNDRLRRDTTELVEFIEQRSDFTRFHTDQIQRAH